MASLTPEQAEELTEKQLLGTISPEEQALLLDWANQRERQRLTPINEQEDMVHDRIYTAIRKKAGIPGSQRTVHRIHFMRRWGWAAAAAVLIVCSTTWMLLPTKEKDTAQVAKADIPAPVKNKASLTINGGKTILLESIANGALAAEGVVKTDGNSLVYTDRIEKVETHSWNNPVASPALMVELPDHTKAWLNASSTISFPTRFTGKTRTVEITGEVYFEVKHDGSQPFTVKAGTQTIEDIGTSFNVNAYPDERGVRTTLIEGEVRISEKDKIKTLKPGQAFLNGSVEESDVDQAMAWKNGLFSFGNTVDLATALRQIGRWYGVEIVYEGGVPTREFGGKMQRNLSLSRVLEILSEQKVHARIEGNKLIVKE